MAEDNERRRRASERLRDAMAGIGQPSAPFVNNPQPGNAAVDAEMKREINAEKRRQAREARQAAADAADRRRRLVEREENLRRGRVQRGENVGGLGGANLPPVPERGGSAGNLGGTSFVQPPVSPLQTKGVNTLRRPTPGTTPIGTGIVRRIPRSQSADKGLTTVWSPDPVMVWVIGMPLVLISSITRTAGASKTLWDLLWKQGVTPKTSAQAQDTSWSIIKGALVDTGFLFVLFVLAGVSDTLARSVMYFLFALWALWFLRNPTAVTAFAKTVGTITRGQ